jgi:hypothetical protein
VHPYQAELKRLSTELLVAKENAQELFLCSVLQNEDRCLAEFCKYVIRHNGNRENIPTIKARNGKLITDPTKKGNSLNSYYASLFSYERNNLKVKLAKSGKPFTICSNIIRKRLSAMWRLLNLIHNFAKHNVGM